MRLSLSQRGKYIKQTNGYGYATTQMRNSLERQGFNLGINDPDADVQIWFDQPWFWTWDEGTYRVGYHPWESTEIHPDWLRAMQVCDEVWTPSEIIANWYREWGLPNVHVYEHGVDPIWTTAEREVTDTIKFLHVGGEAARKGADITLDAFRAAFQGYRDDVELTLKMINEGWMVKKLGKVTVLNETLSVSDLISLYHQSHAFIYPSWGEGFGLNPLQAMATGMPTICTAGWAPYERFLDPDLALDSTLVDSPWPTLHPGKMFQPNFDDLVDKLRYVADNYETVQADAMPRAEAVKAEYCWDRKTYEAFSALEWRLFSQGKIPNPPGL